MLFKDNLHTILVLILVPKHFNSIIIIFIIAQKCINNFVKASLLKFKILN